MLRKSLLFTLFIIVMQTADARLAHAASLMKETPSAEEVKRSIARLGIGVTARVKVRLRSGARMEGFIESAGEDHFYLVRTDERRGTAAVIPYSDVVQLKSKRASVDWRNVSVRIGVGAGAMIGFLRSLPLTLQLPPQPPRQ